MRDTRYRAYLHHRAGLHRISAIGDTLDADKLAYMRVYDSNDSRDVRTLKGMFGALVGLAEHHTAIATETESYLETLFDYCQYLTATGQ